MPTDLVEDLIERSRAALAEHTPQLAIRDILAELVRNPSKLESGLDPVTEGGITPIYRSDELTLIRIAWTPGIKLYPHEHGTWAVAAMYGGTEDNVFWRRGPNGLEQVGGRELANGEVSVMGHDAIHSVANSRREYAVAVHAYGSDFFSDVPARSEWDPDTLEERPRDVPGTMRLFEEANAAWRAGRDG
jgi:predicted metal-dependent enzyme (double-stranded beta helix superfamily)